MNGQHRPWIVLPIGNGETRVDTFPHSQGELVIVTRGRQHEIVAAWIVDSARRVRTASTPADYIPVWWENREGDEAAA